MKDTEKLAYTVPEAAKACTLSVPFLYTLMRRGQLRFTKIGERRIIPRQALIDLIEGREGAA